MSVVVIQTGQCGNQLGTALLNELFRHIHSHDADSSTSSDDNEIFFRPSRKNSSYYARAVCLDTEPKVINECVTQVRNSPQEFSRKWLFDTRSTAYRHGGAGNNWAVGYEMFSGEFLDISMNCIARELDLCERAPSIMILHSVAGGTGSGLGTRVTEACSEYFPEISKVNVAITPYHFGEVVVQHYNALLSLSKIAAASDGVFLFENEVAQVLCKEMKRLERPTLCDINAVIAANLLPAILPKYDNCRHRSSCCLLSDDLQLLCPHPGYKFLDVKLTPQTSESAINYTFDSWNSLLSTLLKMQLRGSPSERGLGSGPWVTSGGSTTSSQSSNNRNLSSVLTLHGDQAFDAAQTLTRYEALSDNMQENILMPESPHPSIASDSAFSQHQGQHLRSCFCAQYSRLHPGPLRICSSSYEINGYQRSASVVTNGFSVLPLLQRVTTKAAALYDAKAFVHQYERNGISELDFRDAFRNLGQIVENYKSL